jgi:hypothetical protein
MDIFGCNDTKKDEKEHLVIKLAMEGLTTRDIAKVSHISLKDRCNHQKI